MNNNKPVIKENQKIVLRSICSEVQPVAIYVDADFFDIYPLHINLNHSKRLDKHEAELQLSIHEIYDNWVYDKKTNNYLQCPDLHAYLEILNFCTLQPDLQYILDIFNLESKQYKKRAKRELKDFSRQSSLYTKIYKLESTLIQFLQSNFNSND